MDREAWRATVHVVTRVGHNLGTKTPPLEEKMGKGCNDRLQKK